jgi:hypothetical protein
MFQARRAAARVLCGAAVALASFASHAAPELGVYRWDAPSGPADVDGFGQWLGRPASVATAFEPSGTWADIEGAEWQLAPWSQWVRAQSGRNLSLAIPLLPSSGASLASCSAGQYDSHWANLANNLAYYGLHWAYLRLGWEMDGTWYTWSAAQGSGKEASFAGCFRRVVQVMRQAQPANQWKFVLNPTIGWRDSSYLDAVWPGDAYVDVVAIDFYDQSWAGNTYPYPSSCDAACRLARQQNAWNDYSRLLYILRDFALAHGKTVAFPEWGVAIRPDGHGGGDNPYYIRNMYDFIQNPNNKVAFHSYWDVAASDLEAQLSGATKFPQSAALFKQLFSAAPTSANTPPTVSITSPSAGQTVSGTVAYAANATDNAGVSRVDFSVDSTALLSDTTSPYGGSLDTTKLANGTHVLKAVAYDAQGLSATSQVSINVQNGATGPTGVTFTAPAANATLSGSISQSTACQVTGTGISRVVFFLDNTQLNIETAAPWQCTIDTRQFANGTHVLKAVAYNAQGLSATRQVSINVQNIINTAPTVSITSPSAGQTVSGTVAYAANATGNAGVSRVDFSVDSTALLSDTTSPYGGSLDTTKLANGTHVLKAVAYNAQGLSATSQVSINIQNAATPAPTPTPTPTATPAPGAGALDVWFKAPLGGSTVKGVLNLGSSCYVNGTGVSRVQFFLDSTALNTDTNVADGMQCLLDTTKFANGTHQLKAVAYDASGASRSDVISINIQNVSNPL